MAMAQPLRNQKRKGVMFLRPMLQLDRRKRTIKASASILQRVYNANILNSEELRTLCKQERLKEATCILLAMNERIESSMYVCLLQMCIKKKALYEGKLIHTHMKERGFTADRYLQNTLVNLYAKCGIIADARRVFDQMSTRDAFSWTVMIAAYSRHGPAEEALALFYRMQRTGIEPDQFIFASVLPACTHLEALEEGMNVHEEILRRGFESDVFVESALVDMYAKCGSLEKAREVFDKMHQRNVVSWNTMIAGYAQNGDVEEALKLFQKMPERSMVSWNAMITGYVQNGYVDEALKLFQKMPQQDVVSWTAIIAGCAQNGHSEEALELFRQMQLAGVKPNSKTFASVLPACAHLTALEQGMEIHAELFKSGLQSDVFVESALVDMYAKCGSVEKARNVFDKMIEQDLVSWNAMIAAYAKHGPFDEALTLFHQMQQTGTEPNQFTFASVLPACAHLAAMEQGLEIHKEIIRNGYQSYVFMKNALVDMYAKCGKIDKARHVFDKMQQRDVVSWTAMIAGYTQNGYVDEALKLFHEMPERNVISWTAMIAGYAQNGQGVDALKLFQQMQLAGVEAGIKTFASVLPACTNLATLEQGMEIHKEIIRRGFESVVFVGNALVDMYAKCGRIDKARHAFDKMPERDVVSWNTMIAGYAMHGCGKEAIKLFEQMQHSCMDPNRVTLVCVLTACCHAGLVEEGLQYFDCMSTYYHIAPAMEHYGCMVDLLSRAGHLDEAESFINNMPIKPDATVWRCLLGACRIHNNIELGERVAGYLFELDPKNAAPYVLLSNIYAAAGKWDDTENVRRMMKERGVKKTPGCSWIEVNKQVHAFLVGDRSHPQTQKIYSNLESLSRQMKAVGYVPDTRFVLNDVEEEQKEQILFRHSEKLAIAFGLINTSPGTTIRIIKNLRVCGDCHSATKFISKLVVREIVVRDANRYHHFKDGQCSCEDYW
eukprot:Gb_33135 [translate_table: standard]